MVGRKLIISSILAIVIIVAAVIGSWWYLSQTGLGPAPQITIKMGMVSELTGGIAGGGGLDDALGAQLAVEYVKSKGGILGKYDFDFTLVDCKSDPSTAAAEAERLITQYDVQVVFGTLSSACLLPITEVCEKYQRICIPICGQAWQVTGTGKKWVFRMNPHNKDVAEGAIGTFELACEKMGIDPHTARIALIHEDGPYGTGLREYIGKMCEQKGYNLVFVQAYPYTATDFSSMLTNLKAANPDFLMWVCYGPDGATIFKQMVELGIKVYLVIGLGAAHSQKWLYDTVGAPAEYLISVDYPGPYISNPDKMLPEVREAYQWFLNQFEARYGRKATVHAGFGFNHVWIMLHYVYPAAIEKYGKVDAETLRKVLLDLEIPLGGSIHPYGVKFIKPGSPEDVPDVLGRLNEQGNMYAKAAGHQWQNGTFVGVWPPEAVRGTIVAPLPPDHPLAKKK